MTRLTITLLAALVLATVTDTRAKAQVNEQDSLALVALYNATDGANWTDNTNWLTAPVSQWKGVSVIGNRVTVLDLLGNQLTGEIPPELGNLANLTSLRLRTNLLTGEIPAELGNLASLTNLDLAKNQLTSEIPAELGNLASLTNLVLRHNQLTGEIPPEIGNLANLEILFLFFNQLTGEIPPEIGKLTNLTVLRLLGNQLTGSIPPELGNLTNLTFLGLVNNQVTGEIPAELGNLTNLEGLDLAKNQLTGEIPAELGNLASLTSLFLNYNHQLSGSLPLSLTNLVNLRTFNFSFTSLCEPPDPAFQTWLQGISNLWSTTATCIPTATEKTTELPTDFALESNYPNPFNPATRIRYALPTRSSVRLVVYNALGRLVEVLVEADQAAGWHEVTFEAGPLSSGVYFYRLEAGAFRAARPMLLHR